MKLKDILVNCNLLEIVGDKDLDILDITFDSRKVKPGTLFFAVKGTQVDGHDYIDKAVEKGASAIVCEKMPRKKAEGTTYAMVIQSMCEDEGRNNVNMNASGRRCASTVFIMIISGLILYLVYGVGARDLGERLERRKRRRERWQKLTGRKTAVE